LRIFRKRAHFASSFTTSNFTSGKGSTLVEDEMNATLFVPAVGWKSQFKEDEEEK
jgi:hypothetical protein